MKSLREPLHRAAPVARAAITGALITHSATAQTETTAATSRTLPPPPAASDRARGTEFRTDLVLDTGRVPFRPVGERGLQFQLHGEYQLRVSALSDLRLPAAARLDDRLRVVHWLRLTPRLDVSPRLAIVGQLDAPAGFIAGERSELVSSADPDYASREPFGVDPRWLYLEWHTPLGSLRAGQQPWHWGLGLVANDGDHPTLFGDYRGGARVERIALSTRPGGATSPVTLEAALDLVFEDAHAELLDGDRAVQGVLAATYADRNDNSVGFMGVYRHQTRDDTDSTRVLLLDSSGRLNMKIPDTSGHVFGEYEVAYLVGETGESRIAASEDGQDREDYRALGAVARVGFVHTRGVGAERFGRFVTQLEWGWASGDANPDDGVHRRFRFDPNYNVGLILFDEVLAWKTARAANIAREDRDLDRGPGVRRLPSNGSVFGASYVNPTFVFRPLATLDLKLGVLVAQATSDIVDPVQAVTGSTYRNFDGGNMHDHDLGLELDGGIEYRYRIPAVPAVLQLGAQAAVLFPGNALADVNGNRLDKQYLAVGRLGLQY